MKKILILLSAVIAVTTSSIIHFEQPLYTSAVPAVHTPKLYHNQDSFGQYSYGYSGGPSIKSEQKTIDGVTRGTYSYIDSDGNLQSVQYTADAEHGFRVSATNLPVAPTDDKITVQDTPEVAQAKIEHLNAFREAELRAAKDENELDENGMPISTMTSNGSSDRNEENENHTNNNDNNNINNNNNENIDNHSSENNNMSNSNEETPPADTIRQLSPLEYHDLRPVNIPVPSTSYIHVSTPAHAYSTRIYGPSLYSYSIPRTYTTYTKGITALPQYYSSGYLLGNNNGFDSDNIGRGHITGDNSGIENVH